MLLLIEATYLYEPTNNEAFADEERKAFAGHRLWTVAEIAAVHKVRIATVYHWLRKYPIEARLGFKYGLIIRLIPESEYQRLMSFVCPSQHSDHPRAQAWAAIQARRSKHGKRGAAARWRRAAPRTPGTKPNDPSS